MQAMIERGVIGDFRAPDILRCGFTPLYIGFEDVWRAVEVLRDILDSGAWRDPRFQVRPRHLTARCIWKIRCWIRKVYSGIRCFDATAHQYSVGQPTLLQSAARIYESVTL